jgi:translation initiation factor 3 subunit B
MENGYHLYDFKGELLRDEPVDKLCKWLWRPRPASLLTKEEQKSVRKNLREYSKVFEQEDADRDASADFAEVERRRAMLEEWLAYRETVEADVRAERVEMGQPADPLEGLVNRDEEDDQVIEELIEEVVEEVEEIVA